MKSKEFYHTKVNIIEYQFDKIYLEEISKELIETVKLFNSSVDVKHKKQLAKVLPINFPICRFCRETIINSNFKVFLNKKDKYIQIICPLIYCREIDGTKYYLSCCENCLLDHFKDNPPKSKKYYFMKANVYGQYCFGYSNEEYKKICSMTTGVTEQSLIRKYGNLIGKEKWQEYCKKQSETNSFEYKKSKYNWTKEQFNEFNKSRAVTLKNLKIKYGEILGQEVYDNYTYLQSYKKSYQYMVDTFGIDKANEINKSKALTLENYIKRLGETEGLIQYEIAINNHKNYFSKISQEFFNKIDEIISKKYTTYYATKNNEYGVNLGNSYVRLDYFILELNLCIEFNGTYFHADPNFFNENDHPNPFNKKVTAKEIWENDKNRYKLLKETKNIDTIVVWENDFRNGNINIEDFIKTTLKILY